MDERDGTRRPVPPFNRLSFQSGEPVTRIGTGKIGGKAQGLAFIRDIVESELGGEVFPGIRIDIPTLTVLATDVFDTFMETNDLHEIAFSDAPDDRIAHAFRTASLPIEVVGELQAIVDQVHVPLAVRSSSLLEDALHRPFAGVYETKMTPNNQHDPAERFRKLAEAVKFVWASTYFRTAKDYIRATDNAIQDEKMAVIIQQVVGARRGDRFYPDLSGVGRSYNFYPTGRAKPEQGVINLALGLGMTIVDGGISWSYSPAHPKAPPPFASAGDLVKNTQCEFWAVNMGKPPQYDPIADTEYLVQADLQAAEYDDTLRYIASTYDPRSDRLSPGTGMPGPRVVNFAPLLVLREYAFNDAVKKMLTACEQAVGTAVEIEFAMTFPRKDADEPARLGLLQVRPMVVSQQPVEITEDDLTGPDVLVFSNHVMGNGIVNTIQDVVYVRPQSFEACHTPTIAAELAKLNTPLFAEGRPYLLMGFGRWGSSDPWLGIPVEWGQICGAKVIVEATLPNMMVDPSQGSHFFHNITSFEVSYLSVRQNTTPGINWAWLDEQDAEAETEFARHVRLAAPLLVKVDGRTGHGAIWRGAETKPRRPPEVDQDTTMTTADKTSEQLLQSLQERAKELNCLYRVDEILNRQDRPAEEIYSDLIDALPAGWQYPDVCEGALSLIGDICVPPAFSESPWRQTADIVVQGEKVGDITVCYTEEKPKADEGPFLREERRLINAIAERIGLFLLQHQLREDRASWETAMHGISARQSQPWRVLLEFLQRTDPNLLVRITRKMINHLCWNGVEEANALLQESLDEGGLLESGNDDGNRPLQRRRMLETAGLSDETFNLATQHLGEDEIISLVQSWINEEKSTFLIKSLENPGSGVAEMAEAVERYQAAAIEDSELPQAVQTSLKVALLRRFFVDQPSFINIAKDFVEVKDFYDLVQHLIYPAKSQGKLGGKGAGLFLATQIIRKSLEHDDLFSNVGIPKTWYIASDTLLEFVHYNNLDEVYNRKYMEIDRIRQDYPHIIHVFKNSSFPPDIINALAAALDDFEDRPLIVRSSSLLEDQVGASFSGKYKSLFLANQGSKKQRLEALQDAIAEVYASVFSPDPIEYRAERGLLDFREEMGILIQEVVGKQIGKYFLPAFAGVAFSHNEFRWSPRIKREDGLVRMVPGLGTRAVDRVADDYPALIAPGQPGLRVNVTADEIVRYSPKKIDVINLEKNDFETIDMRELLRDCGDDYPAARRIVSLVEHDHIRKPSGLEPDWETDDLVVTFEGLISDTPFISQMAALLKLLREKLNMPVDIEFASDGENFYIVQCRSQSHAEEHAPASIPRDLPPDKVIFSADRYVSNGQVRDITHIVYVDPDEYAAVGDLAKLKDIGRAVGKLNKFLPKRQFILMGPGRWGSRGDIKLGVPVTYSDINNTAMLLEIARQKGNYLPELSFGTHFFQDLVEAGIRYLPLYPDQTGIAFNEPFLRRSTNILPEMLPRFAHLADVLRVIDVPRQTDGQILRILMNADLDEAVGVLASPSTDDAEPTGRVQWAVEAAPENHWRWRLRMAEQIARHLDAARFGVKGIYVFGSTKNATAGPGSDIDIIIHIDDEKPDHAELSTWLDGWSRSLAEINYLRTGYKSDGLLDVHYVTDDDIDRQTSYAAKIGAITDAARPLTMEEASTD